MTYIFWVLSRYKGLWEKKNFINSCRSLRALINNIKVSTTQFGMSFLWKELAKRLSFSLIMAEWTFPLFSNSNSFRLQLIFGRFEPTTQIPKLPLFKVLSPIFYFIDISKCVNCWSKSARTGQDGEILP